MQLTPKYTSAIALMALALGGNALLADQPNLGLATIYTFQGAGGMNPTGGLISDSKGNLYGTAAFGGATGNGSVYQLVPPAVSGGAWTQNVLYSFTGSADGGSPYQGLVSDINGNLYGVTQQGGMSNGACIGGTCGVIYQLTPPATAGGAWTQSVLYSFTGNTDGGNPNGNLVFDTHGVIYGTAIAGGIVNSACPGLVFDIQAGCGVVFKLAPPAAVGDTWKQSVLYRFTGGADGAAPGAGVQLDVKGNIYGTTVAGGTVNAACPLTANGSPAGCGVAFSLSRQGKASKQTVLYSFTGAKDGAHPQSGLLLADKGKIYGTAAYGGANGGGTVYELLPQTSGSYTFTAILEFHGKDGVEPYGSLSGNSKGLFGTTFAGGSHNKGIVYSLKPSKAGTWTETVLHNFTGQTDGSSPDGGVLVGPSKTLFGTTFTGKTSSGGTVFQLTY